ncbi:MAG: PIN-like domain-containing protein [Pirellulaceae bacterium]
MKSKFQAYYRPTDDEFKHLWNEATFALDANVLLNLYTYSEATRDEILALLEQIKDRLWIPFQAALEYHTNRVGLIDKESRKYSEISGVLNTAKSALEANKRHPFIADKTMKDFRGIVDVLLSELAKGEEALSTWIREDDPIRRRLADLFEGRVGDAFSEPELAEIYKQGKVRYEHRIPPGFSDQGKPIPRRYGDLVLWKQVITYAIKEKKSVVVVTDDGKPDWWHMLGDRTRLGPHPELLVEFQREVGKPCYLYNSETFAQNARTRLRNEISETTVEEIRDATLRDSAALRAALDHSIQNALRQMAVLDNPIQEALRQSAAVRAALDNPTQEALRQSAAVRAALDHSIQDTLRQIAVLDNPIQEALRQSAAVRAALDNPIHEAFRQSAALHADLSAQPLIAPFAEKSEQPDETSGPIEISESSNEETNDED